MKELMTRYPDAKAEFIKMQEFVDEFLGLNFIIRVRIFDDSIKNLITEHPNASVVNIRSKYLYSKIRV